MPRTTETLDLREEHDRIDARLDELADEATTHAEGSHARQKAIQQGNMLERFLVGVEWALNPSEDEDRDPYTEITIGALSAGEHADVRDVVSGDTTGKGSSGSNDVVFAAKGLVDAPFLGDNATEAQKISAVSGLLPHFQEYLADRVDDITTPDIEGNGFAARVAERMSAGEQN